jgi:hypothetical protein
MVAKVFAGDACLSMAAAQINPAFGPDMDHRRLKALRD